MLPPLQHKHLLVRAEVTKPAFQFFDIDNAMLNLVKKIDMKILSGPHSIWCGVQGNVGWSSACIIETSSITFHSWMESHYPVIQLDVYSCKDFEVETVLKWLDQFEPKQIDYKFLDREHNFKTIKSAEKVMI